MENENNNKDEVVVNEEDVEIGSFKAYPSSDDGNTKVVDGKKVIEDFHMYKE